MAIKYERPVDSFVYFTRDGVDIMVEQIDGNGRRWITGELEKPFGRGINLQWKVKNIDDFYNSVLSKEPVCIYLALESKRYLCGDKIEEQRQFIVQDPDGYLFRFCD